MTTTPCYRCGLQPATLPIAYCAECYKATGARLLTSSEVALTLGIDRSRVNLLALRHGIGLASGPRGTRLFTPAMVHTLDRVRRAPGRPRIDRPDRRPGHAD